MNVCHIISGDLWAGAQCQVVHLLSAMVRNADISLSAVTFNHGRLTDELKTLGLIVTCLPEEGLSSLQIMLGIRRHLVEHEVDLIHCHGHKEHILGCIAGMSAKKRPKVVRTLHGMPEPFDGFAGIRARLSGWLQDLFMTHLTDRIIVVSHDMQRRLSQKPWAEKMVCIHNGIDPHRVKSTVPRDDMRRRLGIADDDFVIGTACRLVPVKRIDLLLEAFYLVSQDHPEALLLICGGGPLKEELSQRAEALRIAPRTRFLGHRDDIYDVMSAFDLFAMTSDHEGIPMVLLEAKALGIPIVAPSVGGIPEILVGNNLFLLPADFSIEAISSAIIQITEQIPKMRNVREGKRASHRATGIETASNTFRLYCLLLNRTREDSREDSVQGHLS